MKWLLSILIFTNCASTAQVDPHVQKYLIAARTATITPRGKDCMLAVHFGTGLYNTCRADGNNYTAFASAAVAVYPYIGASNNLLLFNILSPGTSHSTNYNLTVGSGTPTLNDGTVSYGGNSYHITGYTRATMGTNSRHMFYYSTASSNSASDATEMGAYSSASPYDILRINYLNTSRGYGYSANASGSSYSNTTAGGGFAVNRNSSTSVDIFKNGAAVTGSPFTQNSSAVSDATEFSIGAGFTAQFTTKPCGGAVIGGSLTTTQLASEYNLFKWLNDNK